jgi:precorrin-6B methylase 2
MICALLLGREGSSGFPGKNIYPVLGRPLAAYPMMVAVSCPSVERLYVSTDSPALKEIGLALGALIIERPVHLASKQALGEHAYVHGYHVIRDRLAAEGKTLELLVLLFANAATVTPQIIEDGIAALRANPAADSAVTVSSYNMWSPLRARKINADGLLDPFVPFETFGDPKTMNCDRDSQGDVWFADMGLSIVRPRNLDHLESGLLPQKWMGQKILPLKQWGGLDVDEPWQIPAVEAWLQAHEVDKLFKVQRIKWAQFYDSERTVLSALQLNPQSRVLDIGADPGGLGIALRERFGVRSYTALVSDESQKNEVKAIYPEAVVMQDASQTLGQEAFDLVTALGIEDTPEFFGEIVPSAFQRLRAGGSMVFSLRLTELATVQDKAISYQNVFVGRGANEQRAYVVRNTNEVVAALRRLGAARIYAYGYSGTPSSTAKTPFKSVCFSVFAVTRGDSNQSSHEPQVDLHLPPQLLKGVAPARSPF